MAANTLHLAGGLFFDGLGSAPFLADLVIEAGRVVRISRTPLEAGPTTRNVQGHVVCPGFVDIHTHSDLTVLSAPSAPSKLRQGVTTEIVGNCGLGVTPVVPHTDLSALRASASYLDLDPNVAAGWANSYEYLSAVQAARPAINIGTLTPHIPLRAATVGFVARAAAPREIELMAGLLDADLSCGSLGLSTGLAYAPACYARDDELVALGHVVASHNGLFAWHLRGYDEQLLPSVEQVLSVARTTGCRTQISHLTAVGSRNWGTVRVALERIAAARADGLDVAVDIYPYLHGNAPLTQLLPGWVQDGPASGLSTRLHDPRIRARVLADWSRRQLGWDEITISRVPDDGALVGETIQRSACQRDPTADPAEFVLDLLARWNTQVIATFGGRSKADLDAVLNSSFGVIASDGMILDPLGVTGRGQPHPRCYGCFPRYLSELRNADDSTFARAIQRCTSDPARRIGLDRGTLRVGTAADLVVFDRTALADIATYDRPQQFPSGIDLVMVGGAVAVEHGVDTGACAGRAFLTES